MSDFKYYDSALQASLMNKRAGLVNKYFPEIVAKLNAFKGKLVTVDGSFTKAAAAEGLKYFYDDGNLPSGSRVCLIASVYGVGVFKKCTLSLKIDAWEVLGDVTHHAPEWSYSLASLEDGRIAEEIKTEREPEREDWTAGEIDALKAGYDKAYGEMVKAKELARNFVS